MKNPNYTNSFMTFWMAYPRKVGKGDARRRWNRIKPSKALFVRIIKAIEAQKESTQWKKNGGQFIPYPATWLNREGWDDEVENFPQPETTDEILARLTK